MPRSAAQVWRRVVLAVLVALLATVVVRTFVGGVYRVESTSMEPTLHASPEQVFVRYQRGFRPARFDLLVMTTASESNAVVKRAAGLPGESILISGGDLLVEGRRLSADVPRPEPVVVFDSRLQPIDAAFSQPAVPLEAAEQGWRLDARGRRVDLHYALPARDDYLDAKGVRVAGSVEVGDLRIEGSFLPEHDGKLILRLTEDGDAFELELELQAGELKRARLFHRPGSAESRVMDQLETFPGLRAGEAWRIALENVDNHVVASIEEHVLRGDYEANTPLPAVGNGAYRHLEPRASFAAAELLLGIEHLVLARDLHYTSAGPIGTGSPVALGPDEVFCLGDNSSSSRDSREFGAVRLSDLAGRPTLVVWPLEAFRRLGGLRQLPPRSGARTP